MNISENRGNLSAFLDSLCERRMCVNYPLTDAEENRLNEYVAEALPDIPEDFSGTEDILRLKARLFGARVLAGMDASRMPLIMFVMLNCLARIVPGSTARELFILSLRILTEGELLYLGFAWTDLKKIREDVLANKILNNLKLRQKAVPMLYYEGKGLLCIGGEGVSVAPVNRGAFPSAGMDACMHLAEGMMHLYAEKSFRIKQGEEGDIARVSEFTADFLGAQRMVKPYEPHGYSNEEELVVRVTGLNMNGISVATADPGRRRITGKIPAESPFFYYKFSDLLKNINVGDCLRVVLKDKEGGVFSLKETFTESLLDVVEEKMSYAARYIGSNKKEGDVWLTESGVPVYVRDSRGYDYRGAAFVLVDRVNPNGYAKGHIDSDQSGWEEIKDDDYRAWFIRNRLVVDYNASQDDGSQKLSADFVRIFERALYHYQKQLSKAAEIYRALCWCRILAELAGDERESRFILLKTEYMEQLVLFTKGEESSMQSIVPHPDIAGIDTITRSVKTVEILKEIGSGEDSGLLSGIIHGDPDPQTVKIARILQSYNRIMDIVPARTLAGLRAEVLRVLSLDPETPAALEDDECFGVEDKTTEFKTSFVYPASKDSHMTPNLKEQSRVVFKAVCAFLNSDQGGTLYLGVSDLGYPIGLDNDLRFLKCRTLDNYIVKIQNEAKLAFNENVLDFINFEEQSGGKAVAIIVRPFDDGVVHMDGKAYIRRYAASELMKPDEEARIIARKIASGKETGEKIRILEKAIREKKRAVLVQFSGSDGMYDRSVEPFSLSEDRKYVWCFDLSDRINKKFGISKITAVRCLDEDWRFSTEHKTNPSDIFNWSGEKGTETEIELELDNTARNIILDEYPRSAEDLKRIDENHWRLTTKVYGLSAPCRFCVGLMDHIKVTGSPELKARIEDYIQTYLLPSGR